MFSRLKYQSLVTGFTGLCFCLTQPSVQAEDTGPESATYFEDFVRPVLVRSCAACHENNDSEGAVLFLKAKTVDDLSASRSHWSSVAEQLRNRTMPPADEKQPSEKERLQISHWIDETLRKTACSGNEFAGLVTTRRLNRTEYDRTVQDLLNLEGNFSQKFPVDGSGGEGFDNNGETLFLPSLLLERYLEAATEAIDNCIITPRQRLFLRSDAFRSNQANATQNTDNGTLTLEAGDQVTTVIRVLEDGLYTLAVHVNLVDAASTTAEFSLDGIVAHQFKLSPDRLAGETFQSDIAEYRTATKLRLRQGLHSLSLKVSGKRPFHLVRLDVAQDQPKPSEAFKQRHRTITGVTAGNMIRTPRKTAEEAIRKLAFRAFRRPVTDGELLPFLRLFDRSMERNDPFEHSLKQALRAIMVSPHFLFRIETPPTSAIPEPISDFELASRLSYFLWSSMPDDRLFRLASENQLHNDDVLITEVDRMLRSDKAETFFYEFVGQWLGTIEVAASIVPDTGKFKGQFSTELLMDFRDEPVRLFEYIVHENKSVVDMIDPGYAIVNDRLSEHYQLNGEPPPQKRNQQTWSSNPRRSDAGTFERFNLNDDTRGGILGMGGVHLLTSYPNRTSPVLRGGWVLEKLLGTRVPSPPPNIPELTTSQGKKKLTAKESLALHRNHSACAACHNLMDPIGFALENYDVLGRWRNGDGKQKIDASAVLPSGEKFTGLEGLRRVMMDRKADFVRHLTEQMLGYALGRSLSDHDDCTIQRIAVKLQASEYRAKDLIKEIVLSVPFRKRQLIEEYSVSR